MAKPHVAARRHTSVVSADAVGYFRADAVAYFRADAVGYFRADAVADVRADAVVFSDGAVARERVVKQDSRGFLL